MRNPIILFTALFALISCGNKNGIQFIPVQQSEGRMFLDAPEVERIYIMLDDSRIEATVVDIKKVMADDGKLFISHNSSSGQEYNPREVISVFDMNGNYLNNISRIGRARNEYVNLDAWCLDTRRKEVVIVDAFRTIKRFKYDGTFVSSVTVDQASVWGIQSCNGKLYAHMLMPNNVADDIAEIQDDGTLIPLLPSRNIKDETLSSGGGGIGTCPHFSDPDLNSFFHLRIFDNTIYRIEGSDYETCGLFDFIKPADENLDDIIHADELLLSRPHFTAETEDCFIIKTYEISDDRMISAYLYYLYDKSKKECTLYRLDSSTANTIANRFDIVGVTGNTIISKATPDGARFILDQAADKIPQSDLEMMEQLAERQNSSLILHKLK